MNRDKKLIDEKRGYLFEMQIIIKAIIVFSRIQLKFGQLLRCLLLDHEIVSRLHH